MANVVQFIHATQAAYDAALLAGNISANTIYFINDNGCYKIYRGEVLYDAGTATVAANLTAFETAIGEWPSVDSQGASYDSLVDYIEKLIAAGNEEAADALEALENSLSDVATSGAAEDVTIADTGNKFTADNVEDALAELYDAIGTGGTNALVTVSKTVGGANDTYAYRYVFSQGGNAITNGTIDIAKDMVATNGELIHPTVENPVTIGGEQVTSGAYIAMTIANGDTFYINVADLIEYNAVSSTDEITLTDNNHTISATVGEIAGSKIIYEVGTGGAPNKSIVDKIDEIEDAIDAVGGSISDLDADVDAATPAANADVYAVGVVSGVTEEDGIITAVDTAFVDAAGAATTVKNEVIGTTADTTASITIYGARAYADAKIESLDATIVAATATSTDTYAVGVLGGFVEVDGIVATPTTIDVDRAGAATAVKAEIIGSTADTASANTINGMKAYADDAVESALSWGSL